MNHKRQIAIHKIYSAIPAYFIKVDDMLKVPAHNYVYAGDGCACYMLSITRRFLIDNSRLQICIPEGGRFIGKLGYLDSIGRNSR